MCRQTADLKLEIVITAVVVSEFVRRIVYFCAGPAEGLIACYCTIYCGSETVVADAKADALLRSCFQRSVFWGGGSWGREAGRHSGSVGAAVIVVSTQCLCLLTSLLPLLSFLCL